MAITPAALPTLAEARAADAPVPGPIRDLTGDGVADVVLTPFGRESEDAVGPPTSVVVVAGRRGLGRSGRAPRVAFRVQAPGVAPNSPPQANASPAGDVDGDGIGDLLITGSDGPEGPSHVWVVWGSDDPTPLSVSALGGRGLTLTSPSKSVDAVPAGDVDFDGLDDIAVKDIDASGEPVVRIVRGRPRDPALTALDLADPASSYGQTVLPAAYAASSLSAPGDIDGDGTPDLILARGSGALVVPGARGGGARVLDPSRGLRIAGLDGESRHDVVGLGDVDQDGRADLGVPDLYTGYLQGDDSDDGASAGGPGAAYVVHGASSGRVDVDRLGRRGRTYSDTVLSARATDDSFGVGLDGLGDATGDGLPDACMGADGRLWVEANLGGRGPEILRGAGTGFLVKARRRSSSLSCRGAGDFNGDGHQDVLITTQEGPRNALAAWVVFGTRSHRTVRLAHLGARAGALLPTG